MDTDVYESNFCPAAALSANNTFHTPTGPTLLIVRHLTFLIVSTHCEARGDPRVGFHLLILLGVVLVFGGL